MKISKENLIIEKQKLENNIKELQLKIDALYEDKYIGIISVDTYTRLSSNTENLIRTYNSRIKELENCINEVPKKYNDEEIKLKDLVYGLMLRSGNDAAAMIASYVSGSDEEFVNLMNNKAKELGMKNTIFYNPSGLPTPHGNYSSVYDMALLTRYAMKSAIYREIVSTKKYKVTTNKKSYV